MELTSALINDPDLIKSAIFLFESFMRIFTYLYRLIVILAPILCVIYLMIGGIKYSASSGNRERIKSAKRAVTSAIIGFVIVLISYPFLNLVAYVFTPEGSEFHYLDWYTDIVTLFALVYFAWGGIQYTTSSGNPSGILEAKRTITYAIQGYVWMLLVRVLFTWLTASVK